MDGVDNVEGVSASRVDVGLERRWLAGILNENKVKSGRRLCSDGCLRALECNCVVASEEWSIRNKKRWNKCLRCSSCVGSPIAVPTQRRCSDVLGVRQNLKTFRKSFFLNR